MMSAITSANQGNNVILIEKQNMLGKKLLITGKGRCNITNDIPIEDFIKNIPGNGKFMYSAFAKYNNRDIIKFLNDNGLKTKVERGDRVFPCSDKSKDVLEVFTKEIKKLNIKVMLNCRVTKILTIEKRVSGVEISRNGNTEQLSADKIIIATGGKSYPLTGSTGDGYEMAKKLGHSITKIRPSLVPMECSNKDTKYNISSLDMSRQMQGLSLKNVKITVLDLEKQKNIYTDFGEMIFTHFGVSGPIILSTSAILVRYKEVERLFNNNKIKLVIDLKPALKDEQLDLRLQRDFLQNKNKLFKNGLDNLLPQKMINTIIQISNIDGNRPINTITKEERKRLGYILKKFEFSIKGFRSIDEAIITSGGINIKEINPNTMESKLIKGLYFAGEIIDVDAYTGGFNLQIAYSTGYTAGIS